MLCVDRKGGLRHFGAGSGSAIVRAADQHHRCARVIRILIVIVCCVVVVASLLAFLAYAAFNSAVRRGYMLQSYAFALESFAKNGKPIPDSLAAFVAASNPAHEEYSLGWINPDWEVPEYRRAGHLDKGPYLVLILRPQHWYDGGKAVALYAYPDGGRDTVTVLSKTQLEIALRDDDRRRAVGSPSTGPP